MNPSVRTDTQLGRATRRFALGIEYDGRDFVGWQSQYGQRTVQAATEGAISKVADRPVSVQCAGRTDAGVHALGQVIHWDTDAERSPRSWLLGINSNLPADVSAQWIQEVPESFHARFSAIARLYRYRILNQELRSAMCRNTHAWIHGQLHLESMQEAAQVLLGEHDFSAFRAAECQAKSPVRRIDYLCLTRCGPEVLIDIQANAFLHHMVRNIVGTLIMIGSGKRPYTWMESLLKLRDRRLSGPTAPSQGLVLMDVQYPDHYGLCTGRTQARCQ